MLFSPLKEILIFIWQAGSIDVDHPLLIIKVIIIEVI